MIRPELKASFWKWRDVILAAALIALGAYWGIWSTGIVRVIGWGLVALGAGLAYGGWQRVRFRNRSAGPGVVTLDERRVIYMGPVDGGVADLDLMVQLDLAQPRGMGPAWRIINADGFCRSAAHLHAANHIQFPCMCCDRHRATLEGCLGQCFPLRFCHG